MASKRVVKREVFWKPGVRYCVGTVVMWNGIRLVCCCEHRAGAKADHPWAPAATRGAQIAATLWSPSGEAEAAKLRQACAVWEGNLRVVAEVAAGPEAA